MDLDVFYKNIAKSIKYYKHLKNMTQDQLAEKAGISQDYLGKIETCINKPGIIALVKIINALEISVKDFFAVFE